ncbi:hypothetical protein D9M68_831270 [compost metagenome]
MSRMNARLICSTARSNRLHTYCVATEAAMPSRSLARRRWAISFFRMRAPAITRCMGIWTRACTSPTFFWVDIRALMSP